MHTPTTGTLEVPGAALHYERRGSGPLLLLIPGGAADAGLYEGMAEDLATRYTVVSYDPRGLSRSSLEGPLSDQRVEVWSDDAHRLLSLLSPDRDACVLGCSSGAVVALDLLARHPGQLRQVIAHEPPSVELLHEPAPHRALFAEVRETFRTQGAGPAMARLSEGLGGPPEEPATEPPQPPPGFSEMAPRMQANLPVFLEHVLCPFTTTTPDLTSLRAAAHKLVPAVGRDSRTQEALYGPASRLAELLDRPAVEFPGGHLGCTEYPQEFAKRLLEVLDSGHQGRVRRIL